MKYKENDYIRTKDGIIDKVIIDYNGHCNSPNCNCKHVSCKYNYYDEDTIIKSSPNIIDLIEVGDYVNGYLVTLIEPDAYNKKMVFVGQRLIEESGFYRTYYDEDIKSIVTKEQFKSMEYNVGD